MSRIFAVANEIAQKLEELKKYSSIDDFKIKLRLNANLDVFILTEEKKHIDNMQQDYKNYKIDFKQVTKDDLKEYNYLEDIFESKESIDFGLKYRFDSLIDRKEKKKKYNVPIATFYSYKGGMGRTTTLISYAMDLALNKNKKVCIIDCDFEAPGFMSFFDLSKNEEVLSGQKNGIVEYLLDSNFQEDIDIENYIVKIKDIENIIIVPAGNLSENSIGSSTYRKQYLEYLSRINISNETHILQGFDSFFEKMIEKEKPDIILIDSRTGFNDIFGISALRLSDLIVAFFGSSEQTKPGLYFILDKFREFITDEKDIELILINSILPEKEHDKFHNIFIEQVQSYLHIDYMPKIEKLCRNFNLENLNIDNSFSKHEKIIKDEEIEDYNAIFRELNDTKSIKKIFKKIESKKEFYSNERKDNDLKNIILKHLKVCIRNENDLPTLYADDEKTKIKPETFFYRVSMKDIFKKEKFIIQGFKGTGKTYIYKALRESNKEINDKLLLLAGIKSNEKKYEFIDIISIKGSDEFKRFDFSTLKIDEIKNKIHYFTSFWKVYTWNSIFLDAEKKLNYIYKSELEIEQMSGEVKTKLNFEKIMNNDESMVKVENDLRLLDNYLDENKMHLFVLYDQLDNLNIPSNNWKDIVSPLVDYWWNNYSKFKCISPKIFIRTDLYNRLKGTNTLRLENNKIFIEWSKDEIYAYFFKLIFSNKNSFEALFDFMEQKMPELKKFITNTKKYLLENNNQLKLDLSMIEPFMTIFFGKEVTHGYNYKNTGKFHNLGKTYDWFYTNLRNADVNSISLRPFINLINGAIDEALKNYNKYPIPCILDQKFYASMQNRDNAVKQHFEDLTKEIFNEDLEYIFKYIKEKGGEYRQIFLYESELQELLGNIYKEYEGNLKSTNLDELKDVLISNGIISKVQKYKDTIFYFPQLYKYWLGLKSRKYEYRNERQTYDTEIKKSYNNNSIQQIKEQQARKNVKKFK